MLSFYSLKEAPQRLFFAYSLNQNISFHTVRNLKTHQGEYSRCYVCKLTGRLLKRYRLITDMAERND